MQLQTFCCSRFWLLYFVVLLSSNILLYFKHSRLSAGYELAHMKRLWALVMFEMIIVGGNRLIWQRVHLLTALYFTKVPLLHDMLSCALAVILCSCMCSPWMYYFLRGPEPNWFAVYCFVCEALFMYLFVFLLTFTLGRQLIVLAEQQLDLLRIVWRVPGLRQLALNVNLQTVIAMLLSLLLTCWGLVLVQLGPQLHHVRIRLHNLPPSLHGAKLALLTDMHIGPTVGSSTVRRAVEVVMSSEPDVIAIAGDLVDGDLSFFKEAASPLSGLSAKYGVYFSTGNHEYYHGVVDQWFEYLRQIGIQPLHNEHVKLPPAADDYLCLAGVDDSSAAASGVPNHGMNLSAAISGCSADAGPLVVLCHQPRGVKQLIRSSERTVDLYLAGHTHGGQLLVITVPAWFTNPFFQGLYRLPTGTQVYVSVGVHYWGPPVKNTGMEITVITLEPH